MKLSDAEWIVMNLVWESQPVEAEEVIAAVGAANAWSAATVKTMLHRLVKKGTLAAEKHGKKYRYTAAVRQSECICKASRSFLDRVFGGHAAPALLHLVQTSSLSDEELDQLRDLLDSKSTGNKESRE